MSRKRYSLKNVLVEAGWGTDPWGQDPWGDPTSETGDFSSDTRATIHGKTTGEPQTSQDVEGYTAPLGAPVGFGWGGTDRGFAGVGEYAGSYSDTEFGKYRPPETKTYKGAPPVSPKARTSVVDYVDRSVMGRLDGALANRSLKGIASYTPKEKPKSLSFGPRKLSNVYKYSKV